MGVIAIVGAGLLACSGKTHGNEAQSPDTTGPGEVNLSAGGGGAGAELGNGTQPTAGSSAQPLGGGGGTGEGSPEVPQPAGVEVPRLFLRDVAEQGGTFVAVGSQGVSEQSLDPTLGLETIQYEMNEAIFASTDGSDWQRVHSGPLGTFERVVAGNGHFLALLPQSGPQGAGPYWTKAYTSDDGFVWKPEDAHLPEGVQIVFGNGVFVANESGQDQFSLSTDGRTWSTVEVAADGTWHGFGQLAFGGEHFVAVRGNVVYASENGKQWQPSNYTGVGASGGRSILSMRWALDRFVVQDMHDCCFGEVPGSIEYGIATSTDGLTWEQQSLSAPETFPLWQSDAGCVGMRVERKMGRSLVGAATCSNDAPLIGQYVSLAVRQAPPLLVNIGQSKSGQEILQTSTDGVTWATVLTAE